VGLKTADRTAWLVHFARRRLDEGTRLLTGESLAARWEALAFAYGRSWSIDQDAEPPTWAEVTRAYHRLWGAAFSQLRHKQPIPASWAGTLYPKPDGTLTELTTTSGLSFLGGFMVQVYEVLRSLTSPRLRIRFCPVCRRPFVTKRSDAKVCPTGSCRTLAWRREHREQFKKLRREAYRRRMVGKTGNPRVLIGGPKRRIKT
jgi:hypothetical protein